MSSCEITWQTMRGNMFLVSHQTWLDRNLMGWASVHWVTRDFDHVVLEDHVTHWNHFSHTTVPIATKLARMVTYLEGLLPIKSRDTLITWSCKITWQTKTIISHLDGLLPIKSHDSLIMWLCEITRQTKTIISPLSQYLLPPNLISSPSQYLLPPNLISPPSQDLWPLNLAGFWLGGGPACKHLSHHQVLVDISLDKNTYSLWIHIFIFFAVLFMKFKWEYFKN